MPSLHRLLHTLPSNRIIVASICSSTYRRCARIGLDATLAIPRGGPSIGFEATMRGGARPASRGLRVHFIIIFISVLIVAPHRRAGAPSISPQAICRALPATSSALRGDFLRFGSGTFTDNTAGVPIVASCTMADLIDDMPALSALARLRYGERERSK